MCFFGYKWVSRFSLILGGMIPSSTWFSWESSGGTGFP